MAMRQTTVAALGAAALALAVARPARAGGFEYPDNGTEPLGRGGAFTARADSPQALIHNVAGIVGLPGVQVTLATNVPFLSHCYQRAGAYDGADMYNVVTADTVFAGSQYAATTGATPYPRVCNQTQPSFGPQLLATFRIHPRFAIGVGVYGPSAIARQSFPSQVTTANGPAPSPSRYTLIDEDLLILHPTLALAGAPWPWLRIGVAVQPSVAHFSFATMANSISYSAQAPATDLKTTASATGFFLAYNLGVQVLPTPYLSFGAHVHVNPETIGLSGDGTATLYPYAAPPDAPLVSRFKVDRMAVALPIQARLSARFALPRDWHRDPARDYDPMRDDVFDVELTGIYERSSAFRTLRLENSGQINVGTAANPTPVDVPDAEVPHQWRDVWGVRAGGDYNFVPGVLAARAGVSFETGAQSTRFAHLDIPAYDSLGLHVGGSFRWRWLTVSLAYAHFFMADLVASDGELRALGTEGPVTDAQCQMAGPGACAVNRGTYSAALDTLSLGLTGRF